MAAGESPGWRVEIRDDNVTPFAMVVYVLHTECGLPALDAAILTTRMHEKGGEVVRTFPDQGAAERLAVTLQRFGLHAVVGRP